jgi:hypothetical protein
MSLEFIRANRRIDAVCEQLEKLTEMHDKLAASIATIQESLKDMKQEVVKEAHGSISAEVKSAIESVKADLIGTVSRTRKTAHQADNSEKA